jgi:hypothetical protein
MDKKEALRNSWLLDLSLKLFKIGADILFKILKVTLVIIPEIQRTYHLFLVFKNIAKVPFGPSFRRQL